MTDSSFTMSTEPQSAEVVSVLVNDTRLVAIPPVVRTVLYYLLALANAVLVPLTASGKVSPDIGLIVIGVAGVFGFTLAASNVAR